MRTEDLTDLRARPRRLLAVFAHPDDESYGAAGALCRAAGEDDTAVVLLCLTSGEASTVLRGQGLDADGIRAEREGRMGEVGGLIGWDALLLARLPDGRLARLPFDDLSAPVLRAVEALEPHVVITQEVRGINGHPDHIAAHWAVRDALRGRPHVRLAQVTYLPEVAGALERLIFPTPREHVDVIVDLTTAEIDVKERCLEVHGSPVRLGAGDGDDAGPTRPPFECYDLLGESFDPRLGDLFAGLPARA